MSGERRLLAIVELGGYPNLMPLYQRLGFQAEWVTSQRKARSWLKRQQPEVIVAEYNYQTDFRDRSSNLETLGAILQRHPQVKLLVFYPKEHEAYFHRFQERFPVWRSIAFPVTEEKVEKVLSELV